MTPEFKEAMDSYEALVDEALATLQAQEEDPDASGFESLWQINMDSYLELKQNLDAYRHRQSLCRQPGLPRRSLPAHLLQTGPAVRLHLRSMTRNLPISFPERRRALRPWTESGVGYLADSASKPMALQTRTSLNERAPKARLFSNQAITFSSGRQIAAAQTPGCYPCQVIPRRI